MDKNKLKFKSAKNRNSHYFAGFSAIFFKRSTGFFALRCTLSQRNPKCNTSVNVPRGWVKTLLTE